MKAVREALSRLPEAVFADFLVSDSAYRLVVDLPGVDREGLRLQARGPVLTLEASRPKHVPPAFEPHTDARPSLLEAVIPLPPDASPGESSATLEQGVLTVEVPREASNGIEVPVEE